MSSPKLPVWLIAATMVLSLGFVTQLNAGRTRPSTLRQGARVIKNSRRLRLA